MSKPRRDIHYLADIEEAIQRILDYTEDIVDYEGFLEETMAQDAVLRNLQILGEATKKLSSELRQSYSNVPWREMAGTRDRIVHDYFEVNYATVWEIVREELASLLAQIQTMLQDLEADE